MRPHIQGSQRIVSVIKLRMSCPRAAHYTALTQSTVESVLQTPDRSAPVARQSHLQKKDEFQKSRRIRAGNEKCDEEVKDDANNLFSN